MSTILYSSMGMIFIFIYIAFVSSMPMVVVFIVNDISTMGFTIHSIVTFVVVGRGRARLRA